MQRETLRVGDKVEQRNYEIINACFGKSYEAFMRAWFDIDEDYAAWFPRIKEAAGDKPSAKAFGGTKNHINVLSEDRCTIHETSLDETENPTNEEIARGKRRLVFGKYQKGPEKIVFLGVFEEVPNPDHPQGVRVRKYVKIADGIDLRTMSLL